MLKTQQASDINDSGRLTSISGGERERGTYGSDQWDIIRDRLLVIDSPGEVGARGGQLWGLPYLLRGGFNDRKGEGEALTDGG